MRAFPLFLVLALSCSAAFAQTTEVKQRPANRRALRDARKYPAPYKDSHLDVEKSDLKPGGGGRQEQPNDGRDSYRFDNTGAARVSEPSTVNLRLRKKKKE
jgi:hypothetical protein